MRHGTLISTSLRLAAAVSVAGALLVGCTGSSSDGGSPAPGGRGDLGELTSLLPADARGAVAVRVDRLFAGGSADQVAALMDGKGGDPALRELLGTIGSLGDGIDLREDVSTALLVLPTDASEGPLLLAKVDGSSSRARSVDTAGNHLAVLPDGMVAVGSKAAVRSVADVAKGTDPKGKSAIAPFLGALDATADLSFVYGLPALYDATIEAGRTLQGAKVMSGGFDVADGAIGGAMAFHTSNAAAFVKAYNALNRNATEGKEAQEQPLTVGRPVAKGLDRVVVPLTPIPLAASADQARASRNVFKKLFVGMEASAYAEGLGPDGNAALLDLVVKSEEDGDMPPSPGSVFIRWPFKDRAAIAAFERDVLPPGFTLAPTRFLESDDPDGEYFLTLNLYNSGGGSIVNGARAEWDVFVHPPEGADPAGGKRPRFMIIDALAQAVSADPIHLITPAEPLSHAFAGNDVVSTVARTDGDREVPVFSSRFPKPDPKHAEVARFTREMAISNDYIYWSNGIYDRAVYNASTYNHDAYLVDTSKMTVQDTSRWAQYLDPAVKDAVYYVNTLEYVATPMANLDSSHLAVTPEWLAEVKGFKYNGHETGLMRGAVDQLFRGQGDALVAFQISNETPSATYDFEITDPTGLAKLLGLPAGQRLAKTALFDGDEPTQHLTLSVYEVDHAIEGTRAEWSVLVDDERGRPYRRVLDLMTEDAALDPVSIINLPSQVRHRAQGGVLRTRLSAPGISFDASFTTAGATDDDLSLDWIEAGETVCSINDICDELSYDAETLAVPVHRTRAVTVRSFSTPWNAFITKTPMAVFSRDNAQPFAVKRWQNLKVPVAELSVAGLEGSTHTISGNGSLVGRTNDIVNSTYAYTGDAVLKAGDLRFSLDQEIDNTLGVAHIYTTGTFDLTTGKGTQTVVDCRGPELMCSDIKAGTTAPYTAEDLDASDRDAITWRADAAIDLGGSFGTADSASTFTAKRTG